MAKPNTAVCVAVTNWSVSHQWRTKRFKMSNWRGYLVELNPLHSIVRAAGVACTTIAQRAKNVSAPPQLLLKLC